jgi:sialate O-acetylesterase
MAETNYTLACRKICRMKKVLATVSFFSLFISVYAKVQLPAVIASNMVLQQQSIVKLWGWADPSEKITITTSWNNKTDSAITDPSASWYINIQTPAAGGPYTVTIKGNNTIVLENVLIGEVWVCSGQSNMEMSYGWGLPDVKEELPKALNNNIHFFTVNKAASSYPQENCRGDWAVCDSNTLKSFSAAAYFFGKKLNSNLNVPIGLINTSWGATAAEVWTPDYLVNSNPVLNEAAGKIKANPWCPIKPGSLYNAMIAPLVNYTIAGAIWYQGESNTGTASGYQELLTTMIGAWRTAWHKNLPFYLVQIAPYRYGNNNIAALLREQEAQVMQFANTGMVVTNDLVDDTNDIHPKNKHDVGYRLANWALAETYHVAGINYKSPLYKSLAIDKDKAVVSFYNAEQGLVAKANVLNQVYIAGADKIFYPAEVKLDKGILTAWSKQVKQPVAVRYAFSNTALATLFSNNGLPVIPFRTDDWDVDTSPVK